jgi:hypothetical protein
MNKKPLPKIEIRYDIFMHGIGSRVKDPVTGRKGLVVDIVEPSADWIEPVVQWDDDFEHSEVFSYPLLLE